MLTKVPGRCSNVAPGYYFIYSVHLALWCNGNTGDFDSLVSGSSPGGASTQQLMENIIALETKFMYRHKPTGKWVLFEFFVFDAPYLCLVNDFFPATAYKARNVIEEDFDRSILHTDLITKKDKEEFELIEIDVQYTI